jgi:hypothetical protein
MIRIGSMSLFENVEIRNQRYTSVICRSRINYISWYLYDIYRIISYLRATVSTAENVAKFIYQSDSTFPYNSQAIYPCIDYISVKNKTLWLKRYLSFHIVNFPFLYSNIPAEPAYGNISLIWHDIHECVDTIMISSLIEVCY